MRPLLVIPILAFFALPALADVPDGWSLHAEGPGLYTLEVDSTRTKSTIVEFSDRLYLLEASLSSQGGGARVLHEHREGGEAILRVLDESFPNKPLAAVLHSHWHPHSLSSVAPFLERDVEIVTTEANFERIKEFIDPDQLEAKRHLIRFVEGDQLVLGDGDERLIARRLQKDEYPSIPTPDYLFFELPSRRALHTGCMYSIFRGDKVAGREVIPGRAVDVHGYLEAEELDVDHLVRVYVDGEGAEDSELIPSSRLYTTIETGITVAEMSARFTDRTTEELATHREMIVREAIVDKIPAGILNRLVYGALAEQKLDRALELAILQTRIAPSNANAWDTLGETYYFLGEIEVARAYEKQSKEIDPDFTGGGEEVWAADLEEHRKRWEES